MASKSSFSLTKHSLEKNIYTEEKADCKSVLQLGGWNCHHLLFNVFQDKKWVSKADWMNEKVKIIGEGIGPD